MMLGWNRVTACVRRSRSTVSAWQITAQCVGGHARRFSSATTGDRDSVSADDTAGKSESRKEQGALATEATGEIKPSQDFTHDALIASSKDLADVLRRCRRLEKKLMLCAALRNEQAFFLVFTDAQSAGRAKIDLAEHFQISNVADDDLRAELSSRLTKLGPTHRCRTLEHNSRLTETVVLETDDFFSAADSGTDFCRRIDFVIFSRKRKSRVFFTDVRSAVEALCRLKPGVLKSHPAFCQPPFEKYARINRAAELRKRYGVPYPTPRLVVRSISPQAMHESLTKLKRHILMSFVLWDEALIYLLFTDSAAAFQASRTLPSVARSFFFVAEAPAVQALRQEENLVMLEKKLLSDEESVRFDARDGDRTVYPRRTDEPAVHGPLLLVKGVSESEAKSLAVESGLSDHELLLVHCSEKGDGFIWMRSMESGRHLGSFLTERGYTVGYREGFDRGRQEPMYEEVLERLPLDREVFPRSDVPLQYLLAMKQIMPRPYIRDRERKSSSRKPKDPESHETQR